MNKFFKTLLIIQLSYLLLTFFLPLPAWKMFSSLERNDFQILDQSGLQIDYKVWLPAILYSLKEERLLKFTSFVCKKIENDVIILVIEPSFKKDRYEFRKPNCAFKKI